MAKTNKRAQQERAAAARAQAQKIREEQQRRDRRNRSLLIGGIVALVAVAVLVVVIIVQNANRPKVDDVAVKPSVATSTNGFSFGKDLTAGTQNDGAVTVEFWSDYMCPGCGAYDRGLASTIEEMAKNGQITFVTHPISFLDGQSKGTQYSTRATNAFVTVAQHDPAHALAFHTLLFANQPEEQTEGLSDQQIADLATQAGVTEEVRNQLTSREFGDWVAAATQDSLTKVKTTPYVEINGRQWSPDSKADGTLVEQFTAAIQAAQ